jgi:large subunit ribosomal protein L13
METFNMKEKDIRHNWYLIDATDQVLGRLASKIANIIRGKEKATYTPHLNTGDFVVVINAEKIKTTGTKMQTQIYRKHTHFPGGLQEVTMEQQFKRHPTSLLEIAVKGMVPHSSLGKRVLKNLRIFAGDKHPYTAQNPKLITVL